MGGTHIPKQIKVNCPLRHTETAKISTLNMLGDVMLLEAVLIGANTAFSQHIKGVHQGIQITWTCYHSVKHAILRSILLN